MPTGYVGAGGQWVEVEDTPNPGGGGGGGGGATTIADGADVAQGARADVVASSDTGTFSLIALFKRLLLRFAPPTNATTSAYAASLVVKNSSGILWGVSGYNSRSSGQFLQVHDAAALPADGVAPAVSLYIAPSSPFAFDFGTRGRAFGSGIVICNSSTGPAKTVGSADLWLDAQYT